MESTTSTVHRWLDQEDASKGDDDESQSLGEVIFVNFFMFCLLAGMSATVNLNQMKHQANNVQAILLGLFMQFIAMPFLGFSSVKIFTKLDDAVTLTLLVITTCPGGAFSNWWCSIFNADLSLSVTMTSISTIFSMATMPGNLLLYSSLAFDKNASSSAVDAIDYGSLFISLAVVAAGVLVGLWAGKQWDSPLFHIRANRFGTLSGLIVTLGTFVISQTNKDYETKLFGQGVLYYTAIGFPCVAGIFLSTFLGWILRGPSDLKKAECVTIAIECCYQNVAVALGIAFTMFQDPIIRGQAMSVCMVYFAAQGISVFVYCLVAWKADWTKAPSHESLATIIFTSYEVAEQQQQQQQQHGDETGKIDDEENNTTTIDSNNTGDDSDEAACKSFDGSIDVDIYKDCPVQILARLETVETGLSESTSM